MDRMASPLKKELSQPPFDEHACLEAAASHSAACEEKRATLAKEDDAWLSDAVLDMPTHVGRSIRVDPAAALRRPRESRRRVGPKPKEGDLSFVEVSVDGDDDAAGGIGKPSSSSSRAPPPSPSSPRTIPLFSSSSPDLGREQRARLKKLQAGRVPSSPNKPPPREASPAKPSLFSALWDGRGAESGSVEHGARAGDGGGKHDARGEHGARRKHHAEEEVSLGDGVKFGEFDETGDDDFSDDGEVDVSLGGEGEVLLPRWVRKLQLYKLEDIGEKVPTVHLIAHLCVDRDSLRARAATRAAKKHDHRGRSGLCIRAPVSDALVVEREVTPIARRNADNVTVLFESSVQSHLTVHIDREGLCEFVSSRPKRAEQSAAAEKMQAVQRGRMLRAERAEQSAAVEKMQAVQRGRMSRAERAEQSAAAEKMQAVQRGRMSRAERAEQSAAAGKVQAIQRGRMSRAERAEQSAAAEKMQAIQRGRMSRAERAEQSAASEKRPRKVRSVAPLGGKHRAREEPTATGEFAATAPAARPAARLVVAVAALFGTRLAGAMPPPPVAVEEDEATDDEGAWSAETSTVSSASTATIGGVPTAPGLGGGDKDEWTDAGAHTSDDEDDEDGGGPPPPAAPAARLAYAGR